MSITQEGTIKHNLAHYFVLHFKQLDAHYKTTINHRPDNVASTPLTDDKATTTGRGETLEQDWKVKTNTNTQGLQNSDNTRANTVKTKVITREPQTIPNSIEQAHDNIQEKGLDISSETSVIKAKKGWTVQEGN